MGRVRDGGLRLHVPALEDHLVSAWRDIRRETEADFQKAVIDLARLNGWMVAHFRPAQNSRGEWRTPVAADGKGFPDLVLVHPVRGVLFRELKTDRGQVSKEQALWINWLGVARADVNVWRPRDWDGIVATLTGKAVEDES